MNNNNIMKERLNALMSLRRVFISDKNKLLRDFRLGNVKDYKNQILEDKHYLVPDIHKSITALINQPTVGYEKDLFDIWWKKHYYFRFKILDELKSKYYFEHLDRKIAVKYPV